MIEFYHGINRFLYNNNTYLFELEMSELEFKFVKVDKKESRKYKKVSKYDPILDAFTTGTDKMVRLEIETEDANYLRLQLKKRVDSRTLPVKVSVTNGTIYLEKE